MKKLITLFLLIVIVPIDLLSQREQDSLVLVTLFNSTGGNGWVNKTNWLSTQPISTWYGIKITNDRVSKIQLDGNNLSGTLPSEIGNLSSLNILDLDQNDITGLIPAEIGNLTNLMTLRLDHNLFTGSIPAEIGNLTSLVNLYLDQNQLTGSIPVEIGSLINLDRLQLYTNQLSGPIPSQIGQLTNLTAIYLKDNRLTGPIPAEIGNLTKLKYLDLSRNRITGPIPPETGNLSNLISLNMVANLLWGLLPAELGNLDGLTSLALSINNLSGEIPPEFGNMKSLTYLEIYDNELTGPIPASFSNLVNLTALDLRWNQLSGSIPAEIGMLIKLNSFYLANNLLTGPIPAQIGNLINVTVLFLDNNQLTGAIPAEINNLTSVFWLTLDNNKFDELPVITIQPSEMLAVHSNRLTFEDLEPNIQIESLTYYGQDSIGIKTDVFRTTGQDYTFIVTCGGTFNLYKWYKNNVEIPGATNSTYTITNLALADAGSYSCTVSNSIVTDLRIHSRPIRLSVSGTVDVEKTEAYKGIVIYPNPAHVNLTIENNHYVHTVKFEIMSSSGSKVYDSVLENHSFIDISSLPNGVYFVRFSNSDSEYILKFIKE